MKYPILSGFLCLSLAAGCGNKSLQKDVEDQAKALHEQSRAKIVQVIKDPYMGASLVSLPQGEKFSGVLESRVTLRTKGTLPALCAAIETMLPIKLQVEAPMQGATVTPQGSPLPDSHLLGLTEPAKTNERLAISYEGKLRGLLDFVANFYGMGWDYDASNGTITFAHEQVKTFTIMAAVGSVSYGNKITNKSRDNMISGGRNGASSNSSSDASSQTAQDNETKYQADVWVEIEKAIKVLLSKKGSISANPAAGTITVRDTAPVMRQVSKVVEEYNTKLQRQVALSVKVWALDINTKNEAGLDVMAMFKNASFSAASGGVLPVASTLGGEVTAAILDGKWSGSSAMIKAMRTQGKATLITSGSGVTMNNQPMPVQNVNKEAYLASIATTQTEYGQTTEITPSEITVGFAMTVVPHILDRRRVVLQYNISLSALDAMRTFSTGDATVELPKVSTRSFSQRVSMKMGQTLVLAGFEQERHGSNSKAGLLGVGGDSSYVKTLIIITIDVESLGGEG